MTTDLTRTLRAMLADARLHTPLGILLPDDLHGIYRSAARRTGTTLDQVKAAHQAMEKEDG
jgi:hypothetical protein